MTQHYELISRQEMNTAQGRITLTFTPIMANDYEKQRELFAQITEKAATISEVSIAEREFYEQLCPTAFDGLAGYWICDAKEFRNPYYGSEMLNCAKVIEIIDK
ncbi:MAG: DUF3347 domain-containing protein [Flavobacteriales bacterium]|nr:MAG: DUF3347 domain-containing protein [Flavobacteriales bacterium]